MPDAISPILQVLQENLNRAKSPPPDSQLRLDINTMGSGANVILQFFEQTLFQEYLTLKGEISIVPQLESNKLVVSGMAAEALYDVENMGLVCTFGVSNDSTLTLNVKMTPPAVPKWTFATSFYELEHTFFENLSYTSPIFILSTYDYYDSGLNINVTTGASLHIQPIRFDGSLAPALSLIDSALAQPLPPLHGSLREDSNSRQLDMRMSFPDIRLEVADIFPIVMSHPLLVLSNRHLVVPEHTITTISVQSDVQVGRVTLPLAIQLPSPSSRWQFGLIPGQSIPLSSIPDFLGSITGADLLSTLPDRIIAIQGFYINVFSVAFDLNRKQFWSLDLEISSKDNLGTRSSSTLWSIIPELLEIKDVSFRLQVNRVIQQDGTLRTDVTGTIAGTFEIASSFNVLAQISLPIGSALWTLQTSPNLKLSLSQLTKYVGGVDLASLLPGNLGTIGNFTLVKSILNIDPAVPTLNEFSFTLFSTNDWTIISERLVIKNIIIDLKINKPLSSREVTGYVGGTISIGTVDVEVEVSRYTALEDWIMTVKSATIPLPSLQDIASLANADLTAYLPKSLVSASFLIRDLNIELDLTNRTITQISFILLAEIDWKFYLASENSGEYITFSEVSVALVKSRTELTGVIVAILQIAGVTLEMIAEYINGAWEFQGSTGTGQEIHIGTLIDDLAAKFGTNKILPSALANLIIENLAASFNTGQKRFTFTGEAKFPIETTQVDIVVAIDTYARTFGGQIAINIPVSNGTQTLLFNLLFVQGQASSEFLAIYSHPQKQLTPTVKDIVNAFSPRVASYIPQGLTVDLRDMIFAYDKMGEVTQYLFGVDIALSIDLSDLPLVGKLLPHEERVGVNPLQIITTSREILQERVSAFNALVPSGVNKLPDRTLQHGFNIAGVLQLGSLSQPLTLPVTDPTTTAPPTQPQPPTSTTAATNDNALWYKVQRVFGPIHLERIGLQYQHPSGEAAAIAFLLDASLSAAGLTLALEGLSIGVPLEEIPSLPRFNLRGLGLDYKNGPIEIGGAFLKGKITFEGKEYDDYSGTAIIRTETLTLAAIGSYVQLDIGPSMFVYAVLDYPIGGPAFFFVRGLAAGFGYNRLLHVPPVDQIDTFSLVQEAVGGLAGTPNLADELAKLQRYIPPSVGNYFLAIGIRFTSFEMLDSFILVTATFGHRFELDVVGLSTLVLPTPDASNAGVTPIAEVQLALRATFIPDDGFFGISAQLTNNSFLFDRKCHLTGGFAFYTWFAGTYEGDFVLTVGGYHPQFSPPSHYPTVPRLGFNWQVDDHLTLKGSAYYALTPSALMAGASLNATWQDGNLRAWFDAAINFLISWKPYHYSADFHVSIGASYTFHLFGTHHITAHVGADVSIWGPEFTGKAHVDLSVISFTIRFGSSGRNQIEPIAWATFRQSFLPDDNTKFCTINVKAGLTNKAAAKDSTDTTTQSDSNNLGVVNPKIFCLTTDSVIPAQQVYRGEQGQNVLERAGATVAFNIGTMQLSNEQIISTQRIIITRNGISVEEQFDFHPLTKNAPAALWGSQLQPSLNGDQLINNLLTGYEIRAKRLDDAPHTEPINYAALQEAATLDHEPDAFRWSSLIPFVPQGADDAARRETIDNTLYNNDVAGRRAAIASALLGDDSLNLANFSADDFLNVPQVNELIAR